MLATPPRRIVLISAVVSLVLVSLLLWRRGDRIAATNSPFGTKFTSSIEYSSLLTNVGDEDASTGWLYGYEDKDEDKKTSLKGPQVEEKTASDGNTHPFSLPLPAAPSSTSQVEPGKQTVGTPQAATKDFPPPARPGNPTTWASENSRIPGKPDNLTISGFVFYGRRDRVESMHCYLERNLVVNGGWLDNVIWVVNTKDEADLAYLDQILARSSHYKTHILPEPVWWPDYAKIWRIADRDTMYIKIDDDIVWFADDTIERIVTRKLERRDALAVSANIINNPPLSFLHYHMGALHPYFPDLPPGFNMDTLMPLAEGSPDMEHQEKVDDEQSQQETSEENESSLSKRFASFNHVASWRPSAHPNWTGPADFTWSLDYVPPPFPNHRWLRVQDDKALNRTPVAQLVYDVWGSTYESWAIAAQQHYSLLENIETEQLDLYKFDKPWDMKGERIRINFLAILGSDILDTDVFNWPDDQGDEDMIVLTLPHDLGRPILIEGTALAAHFNFMHQAGVATTDLLSRYKSLAAEKACLGPSPPAFG